jgi:hypothetical protein
MLPKLWWSAAVCVIAANFSAASLRAQSAEPGYFTFSPRVQSSVNSLGAVTRLDIPVGYVFTPHWSVDAGVPFYFISPSSSTTASTGAAPVNGLGNVYTDVRFTLLNPKLNYLSTLTGTAPTGDRSKGLSTGHVTVDWSNYFDHSFQRLTPFAEIGAANAVSDTEFFIRPYTTSGFVTHFQAGARYRLARWVNFAASGYAIEGVGDQTVISRIAPGKPAAASAKAALANGAANAAPNAGNAAGNALGNLPGAAGAIPGLVNAGSRNAVFEDTAVTTGSSSIARDEGFSGWFQFGSGRVLNFYAGFTRSTHYDLNTVFFGVGVNVHKAGRAVF